MSEIARIIAHAPEQLTITLMIASAPEHVIQPTKRRVKEALRAGDEVTAEEPPMTGILLGFVEGKLAAYWRRNIAGSSTVAV